MEIFLVNEPKIHFYLCSNINAAKILTMMGAPAIVVFGNKVVIANDFVKKLNWKISDVFRHEISHGNAQMRYRWMRNYFHAPLWLDEGIASSMNNFLQHSQTNVVDLLNKNPKVTSLTKLNNIMEWSNGYLISREHYIK